jgi:hypothetical protein
MEVGSSHVAHKERIAGEDQPRFLRAATPVRDGVGMVSRRMTRGGDRSDDSVPELDGLSILERTVLKFDSRTGRQMRRRARLRDKLGQPGDVVSLDVRLEDGHDRRSDPLCLGHVAIDERYVWIDDRQRAVARTSEEVGRATRRLVKERSQDHGSTVAAAR